MNTLPALFFGLSLQMTIFALRDDYEGYGPPAGFSFLAGIFLIIGLILMT
jgi:hypothetical protein